MKSSSRIRQVARPGLLEMLIAGKSPLAISRKTVFFPHPSSFLILVAVSIVSLLVGVVDSYPA
ncbi:MAG: hypothetical protein WED34_18280 [Planctomycetales bacterium]